MGSKYKGIVLYGVFGILTTIINLVGYTLLYSLINIPNVPSTAVAWLVSVIFAFVTNRFWVFDSKSWDKGIVAHELWTFLWREF